jgi:hypothetical protein
LIAPPIGHFQFSSGVRAIPVPGGFANGLGLREGDRECVGLSEREFKLTAGASPDGIALCIITDCVNLRSECTRLLACAETTTQKLSDNY